MSEPHLCWPYPSEPKVNRAIGMGLVIQACIQVGLFLPTGFSLTTEKPRSMRDHRGLSSDSVMQSRKVYLIDQRTRRQWCLKSQGSFEDMAQSIKCCRAVKYGKSWGQALDVAVNWEGTSNLRARHLIVDLVQILVTWVNLALEMENCVQTRGRKPTSRSLFSLHFHRFLFLYLSLI